MDPSYTRADMVINGREKEMIEEYQKYLANPSEYKSPIQEFTVLEIL